MSAFDWAKEIKELSSLDRLENGDYQMSDYQINLFEKFKKEYIPKISQDEHYKKLIFGHDKENSLSSMLLSAYSPFKSNFKSKDDFENLVKDFITYFYLLGLYFRNLGVKDLRINDFIVVNTDELDYVRITNDIEKYMKPIRGFIYFNGEFPRNEIPNEFNSNFGGVHDSMFTYFFDEVVGLYSLRVFSLLAKRLNLISSDIDIIKVSANSQSRVLINTFLMVSFTSGYHFNDLVKEKKGFFSKLFS